MIFFICIDWSKYEGPNPVRKVKFFKESKGNVRFLTEDEEKALLSVANEPLRTMILTGIYSWARLQSEALMLTWDNVDFKNGFLTIRDAFAKSGRTRTVPLDSGLSEALSRLKEEAKGQYVFAKAEGNPYRSIRTAFDTACRNAKLSDVTGPHVLRHTLVSPWNGWSRRSYHSRVGWLEELKDG